VGRNGIRDVTNELAGSAPTCHDGGGGGAALRISHTTAYELAHRWLATGGAEGLPVIHLGRVMRVPRAAIGRLLDIGITNSDGPRADGRHGAA
jgi:hypothetical protein